MVSKFIMGIDAGGTKTAGCIQSTETLKCWRVSSGPASLSIDLALACANINYVISELLSRAQCHASECVLVCGAAGAGNQQHRHTLQSGITHPFQQLLITTDARISLYGAANGAPVIVISIGTGTVAMRLGQDHTEKQFGGWGFKVGDLGGGADIGRSLVQYALNQYDKDHHHYDEITLQVLTRIGKNKTEILQWLSGASATDFASLVPVVCNYLHQKNTSAFSVAFKIMKKAAREIENLIALSQTEQHHSVVLTGGLASTIYPLLGASYQQTIIEAKGDAVDGALFLARSL